MTGILSVENMRKSDAATISGGISGKELMYRAGKAIFESVDWKTPVAIVCGTGNNAGDGYVLAGLLNEHGKDCTLFLSEDRFSPDGRYYYDQCVDRGIKTVLWSGEEFTGFGSIVDCLFGTGFKGEVKGKTKTLIENINNSKSEVISVDINSGINGDTGLPGTGDPNGTFVYSDITISIGSYKPGHFLNMAKDVMKKKVNCNIGIEPVDRSYYLPEAGDIAEYFSERKNYSHKGTYGYTAVVGGSERYSGAVRLAYLANAAMRSGAGVVKAAVPRSLIHDVSQNILESTVFPLSDENGMLLFKEDEFKDLTGNVKTVAIGMGIGISDETGKALRFLLGSFTGKLIIDADALTVLSGMDRDMIRNAASTVVLTPHLKEFSRLSGLSISEIQTNPIKVAEEYASDTGVILLLKGSSTIVTDGQTTYIVDKGCPGMATAGSGDVLSGILSAVCSYIPDTLSAVAAGAYINGRAGELAEKKTNPVSMIAGDTVSCICDAISELLQVHC